MHKFLPSSTTIKGEQGDMKTAHFHDADFYRTRRVKCISKALGTTAQFLSENVFSAFCFTCTKHFQTLVLPST